jgi:hypothetical protein
MWKQSETQDSGGWGAMRDRLIYDAVSHVLGLNQPAAGEKIWLAGWRLSMKVLELS